MSAVYDFKNSAKTRAACEQGATFRRKLTLKEDSGSLVNLASYTARMQVRSKPDSSAVIVDLTTENGRIELGGTDGTILLKLSATETASIPAGAYVYDLEIVNPHSDVSRLLEGKFVVSRNVTR